MDRSKRIGILTGGGDCPGLNAAIRATTKTAIREGFEVIGIRDGWKGFIDNKNEILDSLKTSEIIDRGGTILGTSRFSPLRIENGPQRVMDRFKELELTAAVVLGGDGTLSITAKLFRMGLPVIGIPKTIDNDVMETDYSIGFQTAVQIATDALDRLRSTAESHHRIMLLEVMGRRAGWIAVYAGLAGGADAILIPEIPLNEEKMEGLCQLVRKRNEKGKHFSIIVIAEGIQLPEELTSGKGFSATKNRKTGMPGWAGEVIGEIIEEKTGLETRFSSLDYIQRGGTPVAYDRNLATSFGIQAVRLIKENRYGEMTSLKGNRVIGVSLEKVVDRVKTVNLNLYKMAETFFN